MESKVLVDQIYKTGTQGDVFVVSLRSFDNVKAHASQAGYLPDA